MTILQFQDPGFVIGQGHLYEVSAVDISGQEGPHAQLNIPAATFQLASYGVNLNGVQALTRGFFDTIQLQLINNGAQSALLGPATLQLMSSTSVVFTGQIPSTFVSANGSALVSGVVAVTADIADAPMLKVTLGFSSGLGTTASITRTFTLSARSPREPIVELFPGPLVFNENAQVQIKFNNQGSAPMEIRTSVLPSEVLVQLKTVNGLVVSQAGLNQTANGAQVSPSGYFVSVGPSSSFLLDPISILVPDALGASGVVAAQVAAVFNASVGAAGR